MPACTCAPVSQKQQIFGRRSAVDLATFSRLRQGGLFSFRRTHEPAFSKRRALSENTPLSASGAYFLRTCHTEAVVLRAGAVVSATLKRLRLYTARFLNMKRDNKAEFTAACSQFDSRIVRFEAPVKHAARIRFAICIIRCNKHPTTFACQR
jgi:hypothetical protein